MIIGALWLAPTWGVRGLAVGAILGALFHLLVKLPGLIRVGMRWYPCLDLRSAPVHQVLVLVGPRILDLAVFHLTMLATTNLASRLAPGSVSALEWGWEFMQLPETVIGTAFGLVAFPTLAELAARGDHAGLRATLGDSLRMVITLTAPATIGLLLLGRPLVEFVYQRGAFDTQATTAVYTALSCYALGLVGHSSLELVARAFFALRDTITPLIVAATSGLFQVLLGLVLMLWLGHSGLALANSVAVSLEVLTLLFILRRRLAGVEGGLTLYLCGRVAVACLIMSVGVWAVSTFLTRVPLPGPEPLIILVGGAAAGALLYVAAGLLLRIPTLQRLPTYFLPAR